MKATYPDQEFENLAAQLRSSRPAVQPAPAAFRASLGVRLLNHYTSPVAQPVNRKFWVPALVVLVVAILTFFMFGLPFGIRPVLAAEVLQKANAASQSMGDVLYDRMAIDLHSDLVNQENIVGEFWQSRLGNQFRFQLTSQDGKLLYFAQRNGNQVWRSYHNRLVGAEAVPWIYQLTIDQYRLLNLSGLEDPLQTPILGAAAGFGWLALDHWLAERGQSCSDLLCLVGLTEGALQCANDRCTLVKDGKPTQEVLVSTRDDLKNIYVLEILTIPASDFKQVVQIDTKTYALIEVASFRNDKLISRMHPVERKSLQMNELLSPDFFSSTPEGIKVSAFGAFESATPFDRVWVIMVSPEPGINLTRHTEMQVTLGYELVTREEAVLQVMLWPAFPWSGGPTEGNEQAVKVGIGVIHVTFTVAPELLQPGTWGLKATLGYLKENKQMKTLSEMNLGEYQWCIRCDAKKEP